VEIVVVGMDHRWAPLEIREKAAFISRTIKEGIAALTAHSEVAEAVILSTCNRSEIYAASESAEKAAAILKDFYISEKTPEAETYLFAYRGIEAVRHLFRVVSGLDSMILGEDQILGQAKDALEQAQRCRGAGKFLTKAFREAITFSKKIKTVYKISETPLSLSSTAVKHIKRLFPEDYADKKVMIIGSGKMGRLALQYMDAEGFRRVYMTNRTYHPAPEYEKVYHGGGVTVVPYPKRYDVMGEMDVVISATASPHRVIKQADFPARTKPVVLIDLALPRDIDRALADDAQVALITIDDFNHIIDETKAYREHVAQQISAQVGDAVDALVRWIDKAKVDSTIGLLNRRARGLADETIAILNARYGFTGKDQAFLEKIVHSEFRKMVMPAVHTLKTTEDEAKIARYREALTALLEDPA
jgi:glutamyl-tRNA reductase